MGGGGGGGGGGGLIPKAVVDALRYLIFLACLAHLAVAVVPRDTNVPLVVVYVLLLTGLGPRQIHLSSSPLPLHDIYMYRHVHYNMSLSLSRGGYRILARGGGGVQHE